MSPITLILVNGFLGSGKTTLLAEAARRLAARGLQVAAITNDQAGGLVDTASLRAQGLAVAEVAGGCFCCQFDGLTAALDRLLAEGARPEVVLAEAVGSCTDLAATVIRPLKALHGGRVAAAPYTVLVDATRLARAARLAAAGELGPEVLYIFDRQVEEADLLLLNKLDLVAGDEAAALVAELRRRHPSAAILPAAVREGRGVEEWLELVLAGGSAGERPLAVDYDRYAAGEAELGWLNARVALHGAPGADWPGICLGLLRTLARRLHAAGGAIAHLKLALALRGGSLTAAVTDDAGEPSLRVAGVPDPQAEDSALVLNARVRCDPALLRAEVEAALAALPGVSAAVQELAAFRPGRPEPRHRLPPAAP